MNLFIEPKNLIRAFKITTTVNLQYRNTPN